MVDALDRAVLFADCPPGAVKTMERVLGSFTAIGRTAAVHRLSKPDAKGRPRFSLVVDDECVDTTPLDGQLIVEWSQKDVRGKDETVHTAVAVRKRTPGIAQELLRFMPRERERLHELDLTRQRECIERDRCERAARKAKIDAERAAVVADDAAKKKDVAETQATFDALFSELRATQCLGDVSFSVHCSPAELHSPWQGYPDSRASRFPYKDGTAELTFESVTPAQARAILAAAVECGAVLTFEQLFGRKGKTP